MVINPIVRVYIPIIRIPIKVGMTIPNIATFDHGTNEMSIINKIPEPKDGPRFSMYGLFTLHLGSSGGKCG